MSMKFALNNDFSFNTKSYIPKQYASKDTYTNMTYDDIEDIDYSKSIEANNSDELFNTVEQYNSNLSKLEKELEIINNQISSHQYYKDIELGKNNNPFISSSDLKLPTMQELEGIKLANEQLPVLEKKRDDLSLAIFLLKQNRDNILKTAFNLYIENDDFDDFCINGRISSHQYKFSGKSVEYYDKNGSLLLNLSDAEIQLYLNAKYLTDDEIKIANYLINTNNFEKLEQYYALLENTISQRQGQEMADDILKQIKTYYEISTNTNNNDAKKTDFLNILGQAVQNAVLGTPGYTGDFGTTNALQATLLLLAKEGFFDGVRNFGEGFVNLVSADGKVSSEQYKTSYLISGLQELYGEEQFMKVLSSSTYEISNSIGNMTPSMLASAVTMNAQFGTVLMGLSAAGNAREQGLQSGMKDYEAWVYGILSGTSESVIGYFLGGIPGLSYLDDVAKIPGLKGYVAKILSEGVEESTQSIFEPIFESIATGKPFDPSSIDWNEVKKSGIYGMLTAGLLNGKQLVVGSQTVSIANLTDSQLEMLLKKYEGMDTSDPTVMQQILDDLSSNKDVSSDTTGEYELKEGESLSGKVGIQFFGGKVNNNSNVSSSVNNNISNGKNSYNVDALNYSKVKTPKYILDYLASNIRKYAYKNTNSFEGLNDSIMKNGLYHFTGAADAIMSSGYIKASSFNKSYGNKKSFFFNGVPDVGAFAMNLDAVPVKTVAVKVISSAELVNSSKLKLRYVDDMAITYDGNLDLTGLKVEKCFFGLVVEDGKLVYKQISESEYNTYENTDIAKNLIPYVSNKSNVKNIKASFLADISERNKNNNITNMSNVVTNGLHNVDSMYGMQLDKRDFGGFYKTKIETGFFTEQQVANMLNRVNTFGYISSEAGEYYSSLFSDDYDIYVKTIHSSDLASIMSEGVRCLGTSTSGYGLAPTNISDINLENTISGVDGTYDLISTLKSANGISQDGNPIDGTLVLKIPKASNISDVVYFNEISGTFCIKPEFIDSFSSVDQKGVVSEPIFNSIGDAELDIVEEDVMLYEKNENQGSYNGPSVDDFVSFLNDSWFRDENKNEMLAYIENINNDNLVEILNNINLEYDANKFLIENLSIDSLAFLVDYGYFSNGFASIANQTTFAVGDNKIISVDVLLKILLDNDVSTKFVNAIKNNENYFDNYTNEEILEGFVCLTSRFVKSGFNFDLKKYNPKIFFGVINYHVNTLSSSQLANIFYNDVKSNVIGDYLCCMSDNQIYEILSYTKNIEFMRKVYLDIINSLDFEKFVLMYNNNVTTFGDYYPNDTKYQVADGKEIDIDVLFDILIDDTKRVNFINSFFAGNDYSSNYSNKEMLHGFNSLFQGLFSFNFDFSNDIKVKEVYDIVRIVNVSDMHVADFNDMIMSFGDKKISQILKYFDNKTFLKVFENDSISLDVKKLFLENMSDSQYKYLYDNLEGSARNTLVLSGDAWYLTDPRIDLFYEYINMELVPKLHNVFNGYISKSKYDEVTVINKFYTHDRFLETYPNSRAMGYNNQINSVMDIDYPYMNCKLNPDDMLKEVITHESIHQIGGFRSETYRGINEAVTQYFAELSLADKSYQKLTGQVSNGYWQSVLLLRKLIDAQIFNNDSLAKSYAEHDNSYIETSLLKSKYVDQVLYDKILKYFNDLNTSEYYNVRQEAYDKLEKIITVITLTADN